MPASAGGREPASPRRGDSAIDFRFLDRREYDAWDVFVETSPQGSLYARSTYLDGVGCPYRIAVVGHGDDVRGGLVLARNEVGVQANPLFVKYLGVLYAPAVARKQDAQYKVDRTLLENLRVSGVWSYTFHPAFRNWLNFYWRGFRQTTQYTYRIIFEEERDFRRGYDEKVKSALRAARRHELRVSDVSVEEFLRVNRLTYTARGTKPPYQDAVLRGRLTRLLERDLLVLHAVRDPAGAIHAVTGLAYDVHCAYLILNGSDPAYRQSGANTFAVDQAIEWASRHCAAFDFEGSMIERIEKFYRGFAGTLTPYYHIYAGNCLTRAYLAALRLYKRIRY